MKKLLKISLLLSLFVGAGVAMAGTPIEVQVPVDHVYSPSGFDSNDNTEIVVTGFLPNLCHKSPMTKVEVKGRDINIDVKALRYHPTNPFCAEVIVPFMESVQVGMLDKGHYNITVNGKSIYEINSHINIVEAPSDAVDEFVYANVDRIDPLSGSRTVILKGYNPSDCFVLDEISVVDNGEDTYSILPKMKQVAELCPMKMVPFAYEMQVPSTLKSSKVLLHVRGMDGRSVNSLYYQE